ncbi:cytidyltransferase [Proteiniclasticum sp. BAD-10]|uniref:nicotinate-nucleotide adenylyltransferase n=1 Tax=Proteiniclasticum sediminis TaxID=2804028 RepID=A0A941HQB7_9CLOT|nr:cytidyltransferase [Proteiniclasticum sediminis]
MTQPSGQTILSNLRKAVTLSPFLKRVGLPKKELVAWATEKKFQTALLKLAVEGNYHAQSLWNVVKEASLELSGVAVTELPAIYDFLVCQVDEDARDRSFTEGERIFIELFLAAYETLLHQEEQSSSSAFHVTHSFQFLTKKEMEALEDDEYRRFQKAFKEDHIYALMRLSRDLFGYSTLDHVAGVHHVGMFIARQLASLGIPLDLGRVSGALAGHDIGKYGVKLHEMRRVPYLHYYYSDIWFKKHGIDYIRNIAVNHSTWDLELENLSLEALILIYSDFRVKSKSQDGEDVMFIYPLEDSFQVILDKLDNVDEAKRRRYERVYAKLKDFEDYLVTLGVEIQVGNKEWNRKVQESRKTRKPLKKPAICFREEVTARLKYHAIDHNIRVMNLLRNEYSMDTLLEEARSLRDWRDLREYIRIFEEYSTYLTQGQKLQVIRFLEECLIHPEDDIRYHSAEILGRLLGTFDEDYRKELPLEETAPSSHRSGLELLDEILHHVLYPGHKVIDSHRFLLGYALGTMMRTLFQTLPPGRQSTYAQILLPHYEEVNLKKTETCVFLMEAVKYIPLAQETKEAFFRTLLTGGLILRLSALEQITQSMPKTTLSAEMAEELTRRIEKAGSPTDLTEVFLLMKLSGQLELEEERKRLERNLEGRQSELEAVFLNNLKSATHWIVKRNNIRLLAYYTLEGHQVSPINTALHLCNLLKVSAIESVRRTAGNSLLTLMRKLSAYERNEVAVELLRALEIEGHRFTEYIPKPLGKVMLYLNLKEFDEIIDDLLIKVKTANPSVKTLVIKTLGTTLESFIQFGMRSVTLSEEEKEKRLVSMISVLLFGMADFESLTVRAAFTTIGKVIFASEILSLESKNRVFTKICKKLITLLTDEQKNLLFLCQSVGLNNIYRFMNDYLHEEGPFPYPENRQYAFFPGTFDPFTLSHLAIAKLIRDEGYEVYLSIDEFSWSKKTLPNSVRRRILEMSTSGELDLYLFPEDLPVNIAHEGDLRKLSRIFEGAVHMVCGSDVVQNASSYQAKATKNSIHTMKHLIIDRTRKKGTREEIAAKLPQVTFLDLPKNLKEVSSTKIRTNIDENRDISTLIDPMAQNYIYLNGFYQKAPVEKSPVSLTFLEKKIYRELEEELHQVVEELFPTQKAQVARTLRDLFQKPSGRVLTLRDLNTGRWIGMSTFHWARSENLMTEVKNAAFADKIRSLNLGRIMVLDGLFVQPPDRLRNYHEILLTETLSFGVSRDYECALYAPKNKVIRDDRFLPLLSRYNFKTLDYPEALHYVDMSTPMALNLDMENILKDPFRSNPRVKAIIAETRETLMGALGNLYPGKLLLPFEPLMLQQGLISLICAENGVPMTETKPRQLGPYMCVPYGDVLDRSVVPNTVTKVLHTEKYFEPSMTDFSIREVPFYLSLENQVKTLSSFNRPVILVDTILHKGYRMNALSPLFKSHGIEVRKIIGGIVSAKGKDLMTGKDYAVESVYSIPRLKVWFNEKDLYPFMGGDALWRGEYPKRNLISSINLILPYTMPTFIHESTNERIFTLSRVSIENAIRIFQVIEEEFHKVYERKLTLLSLGQVFTVPRIPDKGQDVSYNLFKAPSSYLESDLVELLRMEKLID